MDFFDAAKYLSLRYSVSQDGIYCVSCVLSADGDILLRTKPLQDCSNSRRLAAKHLQTDGHARAHQRAVEFIRVCENKQCSVISSLYKAHSGQTTKNRAALKAIIETVALCGKQNMALRGHTDDRSNFVSISNYRAQADPCLKKHIESGPQHARYTGHSVQNELIELCGNQIRDYLLNKCIKAKWFTILADEKADVSCTEQVALCVRYVDRDDNEFHVREDFLSFYPTGDTKGRTLADIILRSLSEWGLNPSHLVGQGYDGAGSKMRGVQAISKTEYPAAQYVHCKNRCLNLAIIHSCGIPSVRNMLNTGEQMVYFISASPQRLDTYLEYTDDKRWLQKFCETRWSQHDACLSSLISKYEEVISTLDTLVATRDTEIYC